MRSPVIWLRVSSMTSAVSQPSLSDSRNEPSFSMYSSTASPCMRAVRFRASWNCSPPMPALTTEFQSISFTLPAEIACDNWYIAVAACWDVDPEAAATLDRPLMAATESFSPTPADVNMPMLWVISAKLYFVRSAYRFSSSRAAFTV